MKRIKKLLKKVNQIVENIDVQDVINKMQQEKQEVELSLEQSKINVYYQENEKYKVNSKNRYNNYEYYNNYEMEEELWTGSRAS